MPETNHKILHIQKIALSYFHGVAGLLITPTIRFRFSRIDPSVLRNDLSYHGCAYRTTHAVESWRIGLMGTLLTGINKDWIQRVKIKPLTFVIGIIQITLALVLMQIFIQTLIINQSLMIPALIGALLV